MALVITTIEKKNEDGTTRLQENRYKFKTDMAAIAKFFDLAEKQRSFNTQGKKFCETIQLVIGPGS